MYFNPNPLKALILQGEGLTLDFKQTISSARKIAKTLVAFANTEGGRLLIGVKDNGRIVGADVSEELYMIDSAARVFSQPLITFEYEEHEYKDKRVLEVYIPPSDYRPHKAKTEDGKWMAYIRNADQTQLASVVLLDLMRHQAQNRQSVVSFTEPEERLLRHIRQNGNITLKQSTKLLKLPRFEVVRLLVNLLALKVLTFQQMNNEEYYGINPAGDNPAMNGYQVAAC